LIVATAVLMAWLLVELARFALGDLRLQRMPEGSLQTAAQESPGVPAPSRQPPVQPVAPAQAHRPDPKAVVYGETDVEQVVRDRLYGGGRRRPS
jgi:hypothetical protein